MSHLKFFCLLTANTHEGGSDSERDHAFFVQYRESDSISSIQYFFCTHFLLFCSNTSAVSNNILIARVILLALILGRDKNSNCVFSLDGVGFQVVQVKGRGLFCIENVLKTVF